MVINNFKKTEMKLLTLILLLILFGCSQKVHRPRYNHWAKPYEMTVKPHVK